MRPISKTSESSEKRANWRGDLNTLKVCLGKWGSTYSLTEGEPDTAYELLTLLLQNAEGTRAPGEAKVFGTLIVHLVQPYSAQAG